MQLYCDDCIQAMSNMMSGIVDAVITDPPYNVSRENSDMLCQSTLTLFYI